MNKEELKDSVMALFGRCYELLITKGMEYSDEDGDRLDNFRSAALILEETPAEALMGLAVKHYISIRDLSRRVYDEDYYHIEDLKSLRFEKIPDMINYLFLLNAILEDDFGIIEPDGYVPPDGDEHTGAGFIYESPNIH